MKTNTKNNLIAVGVFLLIAIVTMAIASSCATPGFIPKCPTYVYEYQKPDGSIGYEESIVWYDIGDTVEIFPSREVRVIIKVSLKESNSSCSKDSSLLVAGR